jgi:hypothetical protein
MFDKQNSLFVCKYMQIALLESLITEKTHNFHKLCSYTFNSLLIQVAECIHNNLYEYINKVYSKKALSYF